MQFRDLKAQYQALKPEIDKGIQSVLDSSSFILGKPVAELEERRASEKKSVKSQQTVIK